MKKKTFIISGLSVLFLIIFVSIVILRQRIGKTTDDIVGITEQMSHVMKIESEMQEETESETQEETMEETELSKEERPDNFMIYVSGIDTFGHVTDIARSDVNILVVVNTETKKIQLISTPRDSYVSFPVAGGMKDKLTHAGIYGIEQSVAAIEDIYDIQIDYYLKLNFSGFVDIVNALGGLNVYSEYEFSVENIRTYAQGYNYLDGIETLAFVRERYSFAEGDYQRARNQMFAIQALVEAALDPSWLKNYEEFMKALEETFETNMPVDRIAEIIKMQLLNEAEWDISFYTTSGNSILAQTYSVADLDLYVIELSQEAIDEAKKLIVEAYGEN